MKQLYIFSGSIADGQFRDDTGVLTREGLGPDSTFDITFKINKRDKYQPPGDPGYYMEATYIASTLKRKYIGNGSLHDKVYQGEPSATITTPSVPNRYSLQLFDDNHGFDDWNVGHTIQLHYEYKDGSQISSFDTVVKLKLITP